MTLRNVYGVLSLVAALPNEEARLKYIHTVAAAAITSEALQVHAKNRNNRALKDCMATVNILSKAFDLIRKAFSCFLCYQVFKPFVQ